MGSGCGQQVDELIDARARVGAQAGVHREAVGDGEDQRSHGVGLDPRRHRVGRPELA
jgi:hypothetical protein